MQDTVSKEQMSYFWKKKEFVYFILSVLVFFIHIAAFAQYPESDGAVAVFNDKVAFFFKESITRFAVPMYFILSGMTFFRDYTNKKYISKLKSRFFTLCIPYLIWNTLTMLFDIVCSYTFIYSFFTGRPRFIFTVENILNGIFLHGCNIPFWYILYLIIFVIFSPIFYLFTKNKNIGIVSLVVMMVLSVFSIGNGIGLKYDCIVFYLLGAFLGQHYLAVVIKRTSRRSQIISSFFLIIYILLKNIWPQSEYFGKPLVTIIVFMLSSYALFSIVDLFIDNISQRPIYARSFAVFALHTNVAAVISEIICLLLPQKEYFALPNFLITVVLTIVLINVGCSILERYLPLVYRILMGKGIKKKIKSGEN